MGNGEVSWDDSTSPSALESAFAKHDQGTAGVLLDSLRDDLRNTGRRMDAKAAKRVLASLKKYVWFDKLREMAAAIESGAQDDPQVLNHLAQARIELGEITTAIEGLLAMKTRLEAELAEDGLGRAARETLEYQLGETMGHLGRAYKQYYVDAQPSKLEPRSHDLDQSLQYYGEAYDRGLGDYLWHGINYVALCSHKERIRKGKPNAVSKDAEKRAKEILDAIDIKATNRPLEPWDLANRIEANLAIGNTPKAIEATKDYLDAADAFAVQSTRRQLIEVWTLTETDPPGDEILPLMNARFAELGGVAEPIELDPSKAEVYEKVWGTTKYKSLRWLTDAFDRATSVARIGPNKYEGAGTGFLIDGSWIAERWAGKPLMLTNAHVCSNDPAVQAQYPYPAPPQELTAAFLGSESGSDAVELRFQELLWTSPPSELDATLLLLEKLPKGVKPPPLSTRRPPVTQQGDARLNILGHPKGLDLRISLQDNEIVDVEDKYIHYRTPTDPGSSGSPVFDQQWKLVALHHASSSKKKANEGIRIDVILDAMRKAIGGGVG